MEGLMGGRSSFYSLSRDAISVAFACLVAAIEKQQSLNGQRLRSYIFIFVLLLTAFLLFHVLAQTFSMTSTKKKKKNALISIRFLGLRPFIHPSVRPPRFCPAVR